ncbi:MAG: glutathione S-transferase family protein [Betaproteobacteria bacterium]|nr:MAG: glutathione S-transferase family protein [Betaproteobacteria bacterium]
MSDSGNCYKVKLAVEQLRIPYRWVEVNSAKGETRTPEFLARNPNGKVPTITLEDGSHLAESNAILHYLAHGTPLLPAERLAQARALQWMFFEQYSHEPYIAVARFILYYLPPETPRRADLPRLHERGYQALGVMEQHLAKERFFAGGRYSIADIALYAYTHCAADGAFDLGRYPAIERWLERVRREPGHMPLG